MALTYPMIGNYGTPDTSAKDSLGLEQFMESSRIQVAGFIVQENVDKHSHWNARSKLSDWLKRDGIPAIEVPPKLTSGHRHTSLDQNFAYKGFPLWKDYNW